MYNIYIYNIKKQGAEQLYASFCEKRERNMNTFHFFLYLKKAQWKAKPMTNKHDYHLGKGGNRVENLGVEVIFL